MSEITADPTHVSQPGPGPLPGITAADVLNYLTAVMRGEPQPGGDPPTPAQRMKAAELLARHFGLLSPEKAAPTLNTDLLSELAQALEE